MLSKAIAKQIALSWIEVWNSLSINEYQSLYSDDAIEISTLANRIVFESYGSIRGKKSLIFYWEIIRSKLPDYRYDLQNYSVYKNNVLINFRFIATNTPCIAKICLDKKHKIKKVVICHI